MSSQRSASSHTPPVPVVDGYVMAELLGRGGSGMVWRAVQEGTQREVALKFLAPWHEQGLAGLRFAREVEIAASLEHDNIVRVYGSGESVSGSWLAMELVEGPTAGRWVEENDPPLRARVELFRGICAGVRHAHQRGVIHRDLKPGNVLVAPNGTAKVADFGLAAHREGDSLAITLTRQGEVFGSLAWMPPEQAEGCWKEVDALSDVYALGAVLYSLLAGAPPVDTTLSAVAQLAAVKAGERRRLREVRPGTPRDLEAIAEKCMAAEKARRYQSVAALEEDVARWLRGDPVRARTAAPLYWIGKKLRRHWVAAAVVVTLLCSSAGGTWGYLKGQRALEVQRRENSERAAAQSARTLHEAQELVSQLLVEMRPKFEEAGHPEWIEEAEKRVAEFPWDVGGTGVGAWDPRRFRGRAALAQSSLLSSKGQWGNALEAYHDAINELKTLVAEQPQVRIFREDLARARIGEATALVKLGHEGPARGAAEKALDLLNPIPGEELTPSVIESMVDAASQLTSAARSKMESAQESLKIVHRVEKQLPGGDDPERMTVEQAIWKCRAARAVATLAMAARTWPLGEPMAAKSVDCARRALHLDSDGQLPARHLAESLATRAAFLNAAGNVDAAVELLREATTLLTARRQRVHQTFADTPYVSVAQAWENSAREMVKFHQHLRAVEAHDRALELWRLTRERNPAAVSRLCLLNAQLSRKENENERTARYAVLTVRAFEADVAAGVMRPSVCLNAVEAALLLMELGTPERGGTAMPWNECARFAMKRLPGKSARLDGEEALRRADLEKRLTRTGVAGSASGP